MTSETVKMPDKLIPVFTGDYRYRGSWGGRGSAKTRTFAKMTAVKGFQFAEAGQTGQILCGREFMNSLDESSFQEIKTAIIQTPWLNDYYECGEKYIRTKNGLVTYTFSGLRHNLDSIKSKSRILLAWIDEAEAVSDKAWMKLIPTVREEGSEIWVTWNRERKDSATHIRFIENQDDDMNIVEMNWRDNPWFPSALEKERLRDKKNRPELYEHIWEGDFLEFVTGAYFVEQLRKAKDEHRVTQLPTLDSKPCMTFWDIGSSDGCAIWVMQKVEEQYRLINFYEAWGQPYSHAVAWLKSLGLIWEEMYLPHDADHNRQGQVNNKSPKQMLEELMPAADWEIVPRIAQINWGIQQTRDAFPLLSFDKERCHDGLEHLKAYRRKWSENEKRWLDKPDKSEGHSEAADALRQFAQAYANGQLNVKKLWNKPLIYDNAGII